MTKLFIAVSLADIHS